MPTKLKSHRTFRPVTPRPGLGSVAFRSLLNATEEEDAHKVEQEEKAPHVSLKDPRTLTPDNLLHMQKMHGNQAVQRLLAKSKQEPTAPTVQRLMASTTFSSKTKLTARKGKSYRFFNAVIEALAVYEGALNNALPTVKIAHLQKLMETARAWLYSGQSKKSSRKKYVNTLMQELGEEILTLENSMKDLKSSSFKDSNVTSSRDQIIGGQMNKLDEVTYDFGIDRVDGVDKKVKGGSTVTLFKEDKDPDDSFNHSRAPFSGITIDDARLANRNLAMYEIDKLLGGSLIPGTFRATHRGVEGIAMQKVEGKTGLFHMGLDSNAKIDTSRSREQKDTDQEAMELPQVKQALSNLYMLDIICGQVDRHPGNYILEVVEGKIVGVKGIDNDLAFGKDYKDTTYGVGYITPIAGKRVQSLEGIDKAFAQRIIDLNANSGRVSAALVNLLTPEEVNSTLSRLDSLAKFLQPLLANDDPKIKTTWE